MSITAMLLYWRDSEIMISVGEQQLGSFSKRDQISEIVNKIGDYMNTHLLLEKITHVVCPGGVLKPLKKGSYRITERAAKDANSNLYGRHIYNVLTEVTYEIGKKYNIIPLMLYPMSSDELLPLNRITSNVNIRKYSRYHAFEHQIGLAQISNILKKQIDDINCIVAYMDDLTSVGAYERGICLDVNDCIGAEGPMGFTSSGDVPVAQIAEYAMKNKYTYEEMENRLLNKSGIFQYTNVYSVEELDRKYEKDEKVNGAYEAMAYQTAKWVGSSAVVLKGQVDAILFIGKGAESKVLINLIEKRITKIAPVFILNDLRIETFVTEQTRLLETYTCPIYKY